ncbi:MAG: haloacid dehalogenase-like hydrolase [Verrucomicrobiota bacterium]
MLCLFDIDGTLVDTGGAGLRALEETTRHVFGADGPPLDLAGSTDLGIVYGLLAHFGEPATEERIAGYFDHYHIRLKWNLANGGFPGRALAGAEALLDALANRANVAIGLLTGNTRHGAETKTIHFGFGGRFHFGAYGCDHHERNLLGPIALTRARQHHRRAFHPEETWIIGDTPKDIACARALGARCLAVATGRFSMAELSAYGADVVVATLEDAADLL